MDFSMLEIQRHLSLVSDSAPRKLPWFSAYPSLRERQQTWANSSATRRWRWLARLHGDNLRATLSILSDDSMAIIFQWWPYSKHLETLEKPKRISDAPMSKLKNKKISYPTALISAPHSTPLGTCLHLHTHTHTFSEQLIDLWRWNALDVQQTPTNKNKLTR